METLSLVRAMSGDVPLHVEEQRGLTAIGALDDRIAALQDELRLGERRTAMLDALAVVAGVAVGIPAIVIGATTGIALGIMSLVIGVPGAVKLLLFDRPRIHAIERELRRLERLRLQLVRELVISVVDDRPALRALLPAAESVALVRTAP